MQLSIAQALDPFMGLTPRTPDCSTGSWSRAEFKPPAPYVYGVSITVLAVSYRSLPGSAVLTRYSDRARALQKDCMCGNPHAFVFINSSPLLANSPFLLGIEVMTHSSSRNFPSSFLSCWGANFIQSVLPFHPLNGL